MAAHLEVYGGRLSKEIGNIGLKDGKPILPALVVPSIKELDDCLTIKAKAQKQKK